MKTELLQPTVHSLASHTGDFGRISLRSPLMKCRYRQDLSRAQLSDSVVFCRWIRWCHYLLSRSCPVRHEILPSPRRPRTPATRYPLRPVQRT